MENKIRVGILFGGRSAEHEVSLVSASSIIDALDRKKYTVFPIGITPEGRWLSSKDAVKLLKEKSSVESLPEHLLLPDPRKQGLVEINTAGIAEIQNIDVVFPVMHGTFGEDGTVQGLLELAGVPYVGAGVLGSAVGMDKMIQKQVLEAAKIRVAQGLSFLISEFEENEKKIIDRIEEELQYPCFVKPSNTGSSIGISKVHDRKELIDAVALAGQYDRKIIVEKSIEKAREIECGVIGNDKPAASVPRRNYSVERILRLRCKVRRWKVNGDHPGRYSEMGSEKNSIYRMQSLQGSGLFRDGACRLSCAGKRVENFSQRDQHDTGFHVHQHVSETLGSLRPLVPRPSR